MERVFFIETPLLGLGPEDYDSFSAEARRVRRTSAGTCYLSEINWHASLNSSQRMIICLHQMCCLSPTIMGKRNA